MTNIRLYAETQLQTISRRQTRLLTMLNRRNFIAAAASGIILPSTVLAQPQAQQAYPYPIGNIPPPIWDLWLVRKSTGEEYRDAYVEDGKLFVPGYNKMCQALRDTRAPKDEQVVQIDLKLLNLLFATQQWMKIHNQMRPIVINSGYRTIFNNGNIEGAAKNSMHTRGKAADFYIDGLPSKYLADFVKWFKEGGVGLYVNKHFVHIDTGSVRSWRG